jgi:type IV secretion system protein TrbF
MKKAFNKERVQVTSVVSETPYLKAKTEWDERIGNSRVQAANWRLIAFITAIVAVLLLVALIMALSLKKNILFVAEITKTGRVVNVAPLRQRYVPTIAQTEYFIGNFIKLVRNLPLDPVVAKQNWLAAYNYLTSSGAEKLNKFMQKNNPVDALGKETRTVKITDINPISKNTYQVDWTENSVDVNGQNPTEKTFSAVFTVVIKQPITQQMIMKNPLGIYIVDFNISSREA